MHHSKEDEYEDFFRRRRRRKRRRRRNIKGKVKKNLQTALSEKNRMRTQDKHKKVLGALRDRRFLANGGNHSKVYNQVKRMAIEIDDLASELIEKRKRCVCDKKGRRKRRRSNFDGYYADGSQQSMLGNIWQNNKVPILIGGALIFFFVTPYGKRIVNK